jgi:hypothetical protein
MIILQIWNWITTFHKHTDSDNFIISEFYPASKDSSIF